MWVTQRVPLHPRNGAQLRAAGTWQLPLRQVPAPVSDPHRRATTTPVVGSPVDAGM